MNEHQAQDRIVHEASPTHGVFFIERGGTRVAELTYQRGPKFATIDHTWVDDALRGTGTGRRLVDAAVAWARAEHVKLRPACSFVRAVLQRVPEYSDVL